ncbi:DoxX family protein [Kaarinaea lacus]
MEKISHVVARVFLGHIFVLAGISKIGAYAGTQGYMNAMGVPGELLPLVIALEVIGGLAIIAGWQTKWAAMALAGFSVVAAAIFHNNFADQMQMILFMKNIAIAGGFLLLAVHGAGAYSLDNRRSTRTANVAVSHS